MARPVTLFTGQWADLPFTALCQKLEAWGHDGPEIACWGDRMEPPSSIAFDDAMKNK